MRFVDTFRDLRRTLPPVFWTVWIGTLINRAGGFVVPLLTFYLTDERGLTLAEAGAIVSLFGAGGVVAALVGGVLADRIGRRVTMAISLIGGAALMLALGFATEPAAIAVLTLLLGFVGELYRPAVQAFVADVVPPEQRLRAFGLLYWAINLGFSIAPLLAGVIASWSYRALFVGDAITMLVFGLIILARVPETRPVRAAGDPAPSVGLVDVLRDRTFLVFWALTFLIALVMFQHSATLTGWMKAQGHDQATFGAVLSLNGILIVLLQPAVIERTRTLDHRHVLAIAAILQGAGFALHGASPLIVVHLAAVALWTFGEMASSPASATVVANLAPIEARGRYQGAFTMSWGLASFVGPLLGPRVLEHAGPAVLWGGCAVIGVFVAFGFLSARLSR